MTVATLADVDAERPGRVLVVGSLNIDHVVEADAFPRPGETVPGRAVRSAVGGKGGNQAVAAARVGADVALIARTGDDAGAAMVRAALLAAGVDTGGVTTAAEPTGTAWITVAEQDNTIVVVAGANGSWPRAWPDEHARAALVAADVVLLQLEVPTGIVEAAAASARGRVVLNAAPAAALPDTLVARCAVLVVNEHEQAVVAGTADVDRAHAALLARGAGAVITTLGARGAVVTDGRTTERIPSPATDVVDTTGAGDAFVGVLCARLAAGEDLVAATRWAVAAGSLSVRRRGTHDSYPDAAAIQALLT